MLFWILLALGVVGASFVLAFRSMDDYREKPLLRVYSLFLVGNPKALTVDLYRKFYQAILAERGVIAFERLFKGSKRALVVFGPVSLLRPFSETLGLSELEDYSRKTGKEIVAWEIGEKNVSDRLAKRGSLDLIDAVSALFEDEEFWWQLILRPASKDNFAFQATLRAVVSASGLDRKLSLQEKLSKIGSGIGLAVLPQVHSSEQQVRFYQERSFRGALAKGGTIKVLPEEINYFLGL